jgi:hypothetical protein
VVGLVEEDEVAGFDLTASAGIAWCRPWDAIDAWLP